MLRGSRCAQRRAPGPWDHDTIGTTTGSEQIREDALASLPALGGGSDSPSLIKAMVVFNKSHLSGTGG